MTTIRLELWNSHAIFASQSVCEILGFSSSFLGWKKDSIKIEILQHEMKWNGMGKWNFCDGFVCVQKECTIENPSAISWCLGRCV
jgi:hypothetical protein